MADSCRFCRVSLSRWACLLGALLTVLALFLRLEQIGQAAPQSDERLWVRRSFEVIERLKKEPLQATTHLGHPGVPPALFMAVGQWLGIKFNDFAGSPPGSAGYIDRLTTSRIAAALSSSLVVPILFWGAFKFIGLLPAVLAASLLALNPRHLAYSRMAHIDGGLTLIVLAVVLLYFIAVERRSLLLKIAAGCCWGLSIATKPTSLALLPAFVVYKSIRNLIVPYTSDSGERTWVSFSDVAAFVVGHIVMALLYTRLWWHLSEYRTRLEIKTPVAKYLWRSGRWLRVHPWETFYILAVLAALFSLAWWWSRRAEKGARWALSVKSLAGLLSVFTLWLFCCPQVLENIARFWAWVVGLSGERHLAFGHMVKPVSGGYAWLFWSENPLLLLLGTIGGLGLVIWWLITRRRLNSGERLLMLAALVSVAWLGPLSVSSKQTWRYALPVVPLICLVAGWSVGVALEAVARRSNVKMQLAMIGGAIIIVVGQMLHTLAWRPDYHIYFSHLTGGLDGAIKRGHGFQFVGQNELVDFLIDLPFVDHQPLFVTVGGDAATLSQAAMRRYPHIGHRVRFANYPSYQADYLIAFKSHTSLLDLRKWGATLETTPIFQVKRQGLAVASVHRSVVSDDYLTPHEVNVRYGHHLTGKLVRKPDRTLVIEAKPERDDPGFMLFNYGFRVTPGKYNLRVLLRGDNLDALQSDMPIVRIDLDPICQRMITAVELKASMQGLDLECQVTTPIRLVPQVEWMGAAPLEVGGAAFHRLQ